MKCENCGCSEVGKFCPQCGAAINVTYSPEVTSLLQHVRLSLLSQKRGLAKRISHLHDHPGPWSEQYVSSGKQIVAKWAAWEKALLELIDSATHAREADENES